MSEAKKDKKSLPVAGVFFLLIVIPLSLMAFLIANGMFKLGVTIKERTVNVLDSKSQEDIKARAVNTANEVASFLNGMQKGFTSRNHHSLNRSCIQTVYF